MLSRRLAGQLIVSCQAASGSPLDRASIIAALATAAVSGGAGGIRVRGASHIRAARRAVTVPVIGLIKRSSEPGSVYITPSFKDALVVKRAGADLVAVDCTLRARPDGTAMEDLVRRMRLEGIVVVADIDCYEAAAAAARAGADYIATTLSGHTAARTASRPDIELVRQISTRIDRPVIAEGWYSDPQQVRAAFEAGAHAVVVGAAITDPTELTKRLAAATPWAIAAGQDRADAAGRGR